MERVRFPHLRHQKTGKNIGKALKVRFLTTPLFFFAHVILLLLLFWALVFFNSFLFKKKKNTDQKLVYECGFKTFNQLNLTFNFGFFYSAALIVLYELEFLFFVPLFFNVNLLGPATLLPFLAVISVIALSLVLDVRLNLTKWNF